MMQIRRDYVALALLRVTASALDIALLAYLFTLIESYQTGNGQSICAVAIGLITSIYDLAALFDPTGFVSETPMVALGDFVGVVVGIASIVPLSMQPPTNNAPWSADYYKAFGLLVVFEILHTIMGGIRAGSWFLIARRQKMADKLGHVEYDQRSISLNDVSSHTATEHAVENNTAETHEGTREVRADEV